MNILITGADGFVGTHLIEHLLHDSRYKISGMVRDGAAHNLPQHLSSKVRLFACDITDAAQVTKIVRDVQPQAVFHLAGQAFVPFSFKSPYETFRVNIEGGIQILEAVRNWNKECFALIVSSGEVYGRISQQYLPADETTPIQPGNPYAASKASIDLIAQQYRQSFGMNVVVARPFNHLGPGQSEIFVGSAFAKQVAEIKLGMKKPEILVGNLEPKRDFTDVRDVVKAYIAIATAEKKSAVYNICSGSPVRIREVLEMLCELSGVAVEIRPDPERLRADDIPLIYGNNSRVKSETGWAPGIPLRQTLKDLLGYWEKKLTAGP